MAATRRSPAQVIAVAALFGAELLHTAMIPAHVREWAAAGWFFLLVSVLEGVLAAALLFVPARSVVRAAVVISGVTVAVWLVSRTAGVPFGPQRWAPEPVGTVDVAATVLELATIAVLVAGPVSGALRRARRAAVWGVAAVVAVTGAGFAAAPAANAAHGATHASASH